MIFGSALCCLEDKRPEIGLDAVKKLLDVLDNKWVLLKLMSLSVCFFSIDARNSLNHVFSLLWSCYETGISQVRHPGASHGEGANVRRRACLLHPGWAIIISLLIYFNTYIFSLLIGRGTVITGKLERGTLKRGDKIEIVGCDREGVKSVISGEFGASNSYLVLASFTVSSCFADFAFANDFLDTK